MNQPRKSTELIEFIRENIVSGKYPPESKIPSLREFSKEFGLTFSTVKRGIDYLVSRGELEKRHGEGTFVKGGGRKSESSNYKITIFYADRNHKGYCGKALLGIQDHAIKRKCSLNIHFVDFLQLTQDDYDSGIKDSDGSIFLGPYDNLQNKINILLPASALAMHDSHAGKISTIDIDPVAAAEIAAAYFMERGVNDLNVIGHSYKNYAFRHEVFLSVWNRHGGKASLTVYPDIEEILPGRAYFFTSSSWFQIYSGKHKDKTGRILSDTNTILTIDGKNLIDPSYHYAPTISVDWRAVGEALLDELIRRIDTPGSLARRIYLHGHLFE